MMAECRYAAQSAKARHVRGDDLNKAQTTDFRMRGV